MIVEVSDENNRLIAVTGTPATSKWPTHYLHWIDICGIRFNLLVGARMPRHMMELSVFRSGQKCVLIAKLCLRPAHYRSRFCNTLTHAKLLFASFHCSLSLF